MTLFLFIISMYIAVSIYLYFQQSKKQFCQIIIITNQPHQIEWRIRKALITAWVKSIPTDIAVIDVYPSEQTKAIVQSLARKYPIQYLMFENEQDQQDYLDMMVGRQNTLYTVTVVHDVSTTPS
jgi:hypothetical protein